MLDAPRYTDTDIEGFVDTDSADLLHRYGGEYPSKTVVPCPYIVRKNPDLKIPDLAQQDWYEEMRHRARNKGRSAEGYNNILSGEEESMIWKLHKWQFLDLIGYVIEEAIRFTRANPQAPTGILFDHLINGCQYPLEISNHQKGLIKTAVEIYVYERDTIRVYREKFRAMVQCAGLEETKSMLLDDIDLPHIDPSQVRVNFGHDTTVGLELDDNAFNSAYVTACDEDYNQSQLIEAKGADGFFRHTPCGNPVLTEVVTYTRRSLSLRQFRRTKQHERSHADHSQWMNSCTYTPMVFDQFSAMASVFGLTAAASNSMDDTLDILAKNGFPLIKIMGEEKQGKLMKDLKKVYFHLLSLKDELIAYTRTNEWNFSEVSLLGKAIGEIGLETNQAKFLLSRQFYGITDELLRLKSSGYPAKSLWLKIATSESIEEATERLAMI